MSQSTLHKSTRLENSTYNIITALNQEAKFLYSDTYIDDAQKDNRSELVEAWNTIKNDNLKCIQILREMLAQEVKQQKFK